MLQKASPRGRAHAASATPSAWPASVRWLTALRVSVLLVLAALFVPAALAHAEPAPLLSPASDTDSLLQATGVFDRIESISVLVEHELANLEASPLFTLDEISQVRALMARVREDRLYQQIGSSLAGEMPVDGLSALQAMEQRPEWQWLAREEHLLQSPPQQEQLRLYHLRTREAPPAARRVEWMQALDEARYRTRFEVAVRVALRKNLLAAVALVKTRQALSETALENELSDYRTKLSAELAQKAAASYLFLYRKTPTDQVQATVTLFQAPEYRRFMEICEQALQQSFLAVRNQSEESARLVQVNAP